MRYFILPAALLAGLVTSHALAADRSWTDCSQVQNLDRKIAGCTSVLSRTQTESTQNRAIAAYNRADAYFRKNDLDRAFTDLTEAIRLNPKYAVALHVRGVLYSRKGDVERAIADYDAAIEANTNDAVIFNDRGMAYARKGNLARAMADYDAAIRVDPRFALAFKNRADAYFRRNDLDHAITDVSEAIRLNPNDAFAFGFRAAYFSRKGDFDRAISDNDEAIRLDPKLAMPFANRGTAYFHKGEHERALADLNQAIRLDPKNLYALDKRGDVYASKGDQARALAEYEAVLRIDPDHRHARKRAEEARAVLSIRQRATPEKAGAADRIAPAETRIALVIGNSAYAAAPPLANPRHDAQAMAVALRDAGFTTVQVANDMSRVDLIRVLNAFADQAATADWAVIYFAGHGIEFGGINYLIPVDARLGADRDVQDEAVPLDRVLGAIEPARKLRLVILDACRNNPFAQNMRRTIATRSVGRGLAAIEPEGGTLVAYAAKHGQEALDGDGQNSPFVAALINRLGTSGIEISKLFRLVRDDVLAATGKRQEPFIYGSLPGDDFFFRPPRVAIPR